MVMWQQQMAQQYQVQQAQQGMQPGYYVPQ